MRINGCFAPTLSRVSMRRPAAPDDWWRFRFWQGYGQVPTVDEWVVSVDTRDQSRSIVPVPRMPPNAGLHSVFDPDSLASVYRSLGSEAERVRYLRMVRQIFPNFQRMIEPASL